MLNTSLSTVCFKEDGSICCPQCGESFDMHPISIESWFRKEDSCEGNYSACSHKFAYGDHYGSLPPGNPSGRRDGIQIVFQCLCGVISRLFIFQHKGTTYFQWR